MGTQKKYERIVESIVEEIRSGTLHVGDKLPTEEELGKQYGVSRQTVRQALTQLKSRRLIEKQQGSGSFISQEATAVRRTRRIAVITTYISTYIFPSILRGIESAATAAGYSILLKATNNSISREREILEQLSAAEVDGILVEGTKSALPNPNISFYSTLAKAGVSLVFINGYYPALDSPANSNILHVVAQDEAGAFRLTQDLIQAGHQAIGAIFKSDDLQGIHRFSGYMDALAQNGIRMLDEHVLWITTEAKYSVAQQVGFHDLLRDCTALVCYNDEIAQQVLPLCSADNSAVRAVRSFDGTLPPQNDGVDFYSCVHPKEEIGSLAVQKLLHLIDGVPETNAVLPWK